jgi:hypothetical protein
MSISCNTYAHFDYQEWIGAAVKTQIFIPTGVHTFLTEVQRIILIRDSKSKGKVVLNYAPRHEHVRGNGRITPRMLTSALVADEWSNSRPSRFIPPTFIG